jgi:hypothetical protein
LKQIPYIERSNSIWKPSKLGNGKYSQENTPNQELTNTQSEPQEPLITNEEINTSNMSLDNQNQSMDLERGIKLSIESKYKARTLQSINIAKSDEFTKESIRQKQNHENMKNNHMIGRKRTLEFILINNVNKETSVRNTEKSMATTYDINSHEQKKRQKTTPINTNKTIQVRRDVKNDTQLKIVKTNSIDNVQIKRTPKIMSIPPPRIRTGGPFIPIKRTPKSVQNENPLMDTVDDCYINKLVATKRIKTEPTNLLSANLTADIDVTNEHQYNVQQDITPIINIESDIEIPNINEMTYSNHDKNQIFIINGRRTWGLDRKHMKWAWRQCGSPQTEPQEPWFELPLTKAKRLGIDGKYVPFL